MLAWFYSDHRIARNVPAQQYRLVMVCSVCRVWMATTQPLDNATHALGGDHTSWLTHPDPAGSPCNHLRDSGQSGCGVSSGPPFIPPPGCYTPKNLHERAAQFAAFMGQTVKRT
ncbi:uncharacterized protein LOC135347488 isoform X2 [Halichondria panicea]|uniref:uncharacterized protein LOC135347488 isoform X2 n=1 Tax=Halichondria panicea TaxID=6063 RepID=UPI00312B8330